MINLDAVIQQTNNLAPLRASAVRLARLIGGQNFHLKEVVDVIVYDEVLTLKLLSAANSAASASSLRIVRVQDAVIRLGAGLTLSLAIATGAKPLMQTRLNSYDFAEGQLWKHSVAAVAAAEIAPSFCANEMPPEAFTAALLHDIGKLIMDRFLNSEILRDIRLAQKIDRLGQLEAEAAILNIHHGELGGLIGQHWQLPDRIVQGIVHHHNPEVGFDPVCDFTCLANWVAHEIQGNSIFCSRPPAVADGLLERVGLTRKGWENLCQTAGKRFEALSEDYNCI
jgi:putative nucleotidyltransferase with HDIG domain